MTKEELFSKIETRFNSRRAFVSAFNEAAGFEALHETTLSRQLSGSLGITNFAQVAYVLFFSSYGS